MIVTRRRLLVPAVAAAGATLAAGLAARNSGAAGALRQPGPLAEAGAALPPLGFRLADGTERTAADYAGKALVLNFWATWCAPCVEEMPALDALARLVPEAAVLPLSSDRGGAAAVAKFYAARGIKHLPVVLDPQGAAARTVGSRGIPTTLLVDARGRERGRVEGAADWGSAASVAMVRALGQ